jgi:hypothetical protein
MTNGMYEFVASEMTTSIHHSVQASVTAPLPQAGMHTKQIMLMIVARPMGNAPSRFSSADSRGAEHTHPRFPHL